jgi:hypothetical protein
MKMRTAALAVSACVVATVAMAQGNPRGTAAATVGGKMVSVDYGRPALKGRALDDLMKQLPADRIWRAGENQVTTLKADADLLVGGTKLPAGKYALYVHAGENDAWELVLNKELGVPLGKIWAQAPDNMKNEPWPNLDYAKTAKATEVLRVPMKAETAAQPADLFTVSFTQKGEGQQLTLAWGNKAYSVDLQPAK